ncbi:MAG: hypothetical protein IJT56_08260, partial [Clostridia bacterium]|nr:hypothetical protein [Clostridia bacterium]
PETEAIRSMVSSGEMPSSPLSAFGDLLDSSLPDECRVIRLEGVDGGYQPNLLSHCRVTDDGCRIVYIANMADDDFSGTLKVSGRFEDIVSADAFSGEMSAAEGEISSDHISLEITIKPGEGRFWLLE